MGWFNLFGYCSNMCNLGGNKLVELVGPNGLTVAHPHTVTKQVTHGIKHNPIPPSRLHRETQDPKPLNNLQLGCCFVGVQHISQLGSGRVQKTCFIQGMG